MKDAEGFKPPVTPRSVVVSELTRGGAASQGLAGRALVHSEHGHLVLRQRVQVVELHAAVCPLHHLEDTPQLETKPRRPFSL